MKAFSWKILLLLVVFFVSSACRLVTDALSPNDELDLQAEESIQDEPAVQEEFEDQGDAIDGPAEPAALPTETAASRQNFEGEDDSDNPFNLPGDLEPSTDDLCSVLPKEIFSPLIGSEMTGEPEPFEDDFLGKGCSYDFGEENGAAKFIYFSIAPMDSFTESKASGTNVTSVPYLPEEGFTVDAVDAQQLWVKLDEGRALVIATGEEPQPELALQLAFLLVPLMQAMP